MQRIYSKYWNISSLKKDIAQVLRLHDEARWCYYCLYSHRVCVWFFYSSFYCKFRHYFLFSLSSEYRVREKDFISRLSLGWNDVLTELTVKSSLLHFFLFKCLCSILNRVQLKEHVFYVFFCGEIENCNF